MSEPAGGTDQDRPVDRASVGEGTLADAHPRQGANADGFENQASKAKQALIPPAGTVARDDEDTSATELAAGAVAAEMEGDADGERRHPLREALARFGALEGNVAELTRLQRHQVDVIDRLHAENQRLRQGELLAATLPLMRDLIRLHDDLGRMVESCSDEGPGTARDLAIVRTVLEEALQRNGLTRFDPPVGGNFDTSVNTAVAVTPTNDASLDRTIAAVRRSGFRREDGSVVRAAEVVVHRFEAPTPTAPAEP
jgi:molecular chaperone GrpE (heat shock protein)